MAQCRLPPKRPGFPYHIVVLSLVSDFRQGARSLARSPAVAVAAILTLAISIAANTAIFSVVNAVLLRPLPYPGAEQLVTLGLTFRGQFITTFNIGQFLHFERARMLTDVAAYDILGPGLNLSSGGPPEQIRGIHVSLRYFQLFGAEPALGRTFVPEEDVPGGPKAVVISDGLWRRRFGADPALIGRAIPLNGEPHTVVGVLRPGFVSDPPADAWLALRAVPGSGNTASFLAVAARLPAGVSLAAANSEMATLAVALRAISPEWMIPEESASVRSMQDELTSGLRPVMLLLLGAVGFVLLIACANVASLLLTRSVGRGKEFAIRATLGATRGRLMRQLLAESLLLAFAGGAAGLALGRLALNPLLSLYPDGLPRAAEFAGGIPLDSRVVFFSLAISLATGAVFGLIPAWQASRAGLNATLKETAGRSGTGMRQNYTRSLLVIVETALAVILLAGAVLLLRSLTGLRHADPGVETRNILTMETSLAGARYDSPARVAALTSAILERLEALPGVRAAAAASALPVASLRIDMPFLVEGWPPVEKGAFDGIEQIRFVSPHFFDVFRIRSLRGRLITAADAANSAPIVLINQALAKKFWPSADPIGVRLDMGKGLGPVFENPPRTIAGIVSNVLERGARRGFMPILYVPLAQTTAGSIHHDMSVMPMNWAIRTAGDPLPMAAAIQRVFFDVDPQLPIASVRTMDQILDESAAPDNFNATLLTIFAATALFLAAVGIYGVMSYTVAQRRQEIGIRAALGATGADAWRMVVMGGMRLTLAGLLIGLGGALLLTRLLASLLYGVTPRDPLTFLAIPAVLGFTALAACAIPAWRAARVDPVIALRYE